MEKPVVLNKDTKKNKLLKVPSGITGLDEITGGGLPRGRPTLVCGGAGCGKTLFAMEFLYNGVVRYGEPGVFMSFEEKERDLLQNFDSLGFDLASLIDEKKLDIDYVYIERSQIAETGDYDLEGLFVRMASAIDQVGAKRVVLDTVEALFSGFSDELVLRAELRRLFRWLKDKGVTAVITGEKGKESLTRHGLEEYVADCVIYLDHRVKEEVSTRRLKIIKYRGSKHGTNEYPFYIGEKGITIFPITSLRLDSPAGADRISTGITDLDEMMEDQGFYRGNTGLVSGSAGTGKTSVLAHFVDSACRRGERAVFFAFEESPQQIIRNMKKIGIDLKKWVDKGLLKFSACRGTFAGLETHLVMTHDLINEFKPQVVAFDPVTGLLESGTETETGAMLSRMLDFLKDEEITVLMSDLPITGASNAKTQVGISSLCDIWIRLCMERKDNRMIRRINILKARGIDHSHSIRELIISSRGLSIRDVPETDQLGERD